MTRIPSSSPQKQMARYLALYRYLFQFFTCSSLQNLQQKHTICFHKLTKVQCYLLVFADLSYVLNMQKNDGDFRSKGCMQHLHLSHLNVLLFSFHTQSTQIHKWCTLLQVKIEQPIKLSLMCCYKADQPLMIYVSHGQYDSPHNVLLT